MKASWGRTACRHEYKNMNYSYLYLWHPYPQTLLWERLAWEFSPMQRKGKVKNTMELLRLTGCQEDRKLICQGHNVQALRKSQQHTGLFLCASKAGLWVPSGRKESFVTTWKIDSWPHLQRGCHGSQRMATAYCHVPNALWWSHMKPDPWRRHRWAVVWHSEAWFHSLKATSVLSSVGLTSIQRI